MDVRSILLCVLIPAAVYAQDPELGRIEISRYTGTLTLDAPRPLDSAAKTLAQHYGIVINSEDPEYLYSGDIKDVTTEVVPTSVVTSLMSPLQRYSGSSELITMPR